MGGQTLTWATQATVWAAIWPVSAAEQIKAGAPSMSITHRIRIRFFEPLRASWRIKKLGEERYFSLSGIVDKEERHFQQDLLCKETKA
jgi:SPP1 family predicted phage head-tail adaptor